MAQFRQSSENLGNVFAKVQFFWTEELILRKLKMGDEGMEEQKDIVAAKEITHTACTAVFANHPGNGQSESLNLP